MTKIKVISLWQPWASAIAFGWKLIETRPRQIKYRGELYIHAAKKVIGWPSIEIQALFDSVAFQPSDLPMGQIICRVNLYDCEKITYYNRANLTRMERLLGNYAPGRYMWKTKDLQKIKPFPARGFQACPFNLELPKDFNIQEETC